MVRVAAGLADTRVVEFAARSQRPVQELRECLRAVITSSAFKGSVLLIDCSQLVAEEQLIFLCVPSRLRSECEGWVGSVLTSDTRARTHAWYRYDIIVTGAARSVFTSAQQASMGAASRSIVELRNPELAEHDLSDMAVFELAMQEARRQVRLVLCLHPDSWAYRRLRSSYASLVSRCYVTAVRDWGMNTVRAVTTRYLKVCAPCRGWLHTSATCARWRRCNARCLSSCAGDV